MARGPIQWRNVTPSSDGASVGFMRNAMSAVNQAGENLNNVGQIFQNRFDKQQQERETNNLANFRQQLLTQNENQLTAPNQVSQALSRFGGDIDGDAAQLAIQSRLKDLRESEYRKEQQNMAQERIDISRGQLGISKAFNDARIGEMEFNRGQTELAGSIAERIENGAGISDPEEQRQWLQANEEAIRAEAGKLQNGAQLIDRLNQIKGANNEIVFTERLNAGPTRKANYRDEAGLLNIVKTGKGNLDKETRERYPGLVKALGENAGGLQTDDPEVRGSGSLEGMEKVLRTRVAEYESSPYIGQSAQPKGKGAISNIGAVYEGLKNNPISKTEDYKDHFIGDKGDNDELTDAVNDAVTKLKKEGYTILPVHLQELGRTSQNLMRSNWFTENTDEDGVLADLRQIAVESERIRNEHKKYVADLSVVSSANRTLKSKIDSRTEGIRRAVRNK